MRELALPVARFGQRVRRPARKDDAPAHGIDDYAAAIRAIRANSDLLINPMLRQVTRGGTLERVAHLEAFAGDPVPQPEIVGLDPRSGRTRQVRLSSPPAPRARRPPSPRHGRSPRGS